MAHSVRLSRLLLVLGMVSVLGASGAAARRFTPRSPVARGVSIGDRRVPDDGRSAVAWLSARREAMRWRIVHFRHGSQLFDATLDEAGVTLDVEATLEKAKKIGHEGSVWRRLRESERARRGEVEIPLSWAIDAAKARALLGSYASSVGHPPVDARIDIAAHQKIPDVAGRELDVEESLAELGAGRHEDEEMIDLVTHRVLAKVTIEELTRVNIEKVVSAYETTFSLFGSGAGRAINIRNAAGRLDGTVLAPGQVLSFNDVVGPRTRDRGFALAPEIQADEMQMGYGGGTCQASTTLYAAALFGALEIVQRQSHSRPSHYTQMGLDATVSYPLADLKIKNTLPFPVMIHAFLSKPTAVRVEILGGDPVAKVEYAYGVGGTEDFVRRVVMKQNLAPGQRILHQKGIQGFDVTSVVRVRYNDGRTDERRYYSGYRPAPEIYWVAPGYDTQELPALPAHAKGVEGAPAPVSLTGFGG
jgi:vancomycin resistance protein YoaR